MLRRYRNRRFIIIIIVIVFSLFAYNSDRSAVEILHMLETQAVQHGAVLLVAMVNVVLKLCTSTVYQSRFKILEGWQCPGG